MDNYVKISRWAIGTGLSVVLFLFAQTSALVAREISNRAEMTTFGVQLKMLSEQVSLIQTTIQNGTMKRYTSDDATADKNQQSIINKVFADRLDAQGRRIDHIELQVEGFGIPRTSVGGAGGRQ